MKDNVAKISVIIPVRPKWGVKPALLALEKVDYPPKLIEVLVAFGFSPSKQRNLAAQKARGEILYFLDQKLVCVGLCDIIPNKAISAVYTYYEPTLHKRSLGKFNILTQLYYAKELNIPYWYPGYWIPNHHSMGYKQEYKPFDLLVNRPSLTQECIWERVDK